MQQIHLESNQSLERLPLHDAAGERPFDCSLKLTYILAVELCSLVVQGVLRVWLVEEINQSVDDSVDIQHLNSARSVSKQ